MWPFQSKVRRAPQRTQKVSRDDRQRSIEQLFAGAEVKAAADLKYSRLLQQSKHYSTGDR